VARASTSAELTRRQLLARAGAVAVGVGGAALLSRVPIVEPAPALAAVPGRCVALGPAGCIAPGCAQDLRVADNRALLADSGTRWVRLWADWPSLMPAPDVFAADRVAALDDQLAVARADGLRTILTLYRTPAWVGRGVAAAPPWERFVAWAITRYGARLDMLEVCNEPNLQGTAPETVAAMFVTAQRIAGDLGSPLVLAGPATADVAGYDRFTDRLLDALDARGFVAGTRFAWTHHNYADVAYGTSRTADVRRRLVGRWAGWPAGDAGNPRLLLTEGGVTLRTIARHLGIAEPAAQRAMQGRLLTAAYERLTGPEGAGVALVTQYLFHTDPRYDSGLCETAERGGARRPAFEAWRALPSVA
jgi:hypothetical protein